MAIQVCPGFGSFRTMPLGRVLLLLGASVLPSLVLTSGHDPELQIINFNYESLQVTWNSSGPGTTNLTFLYKLAKGDNFTQCPRYLLHGGLTSGCRVEQELTQDMLFLCLVNGTDVVLTKDVYISNHLKPAPPGLLHFQWADDAVTVTCEELQHPDLLYEIQHKTIFDSEWQSQEEETCNVTLQGLDSDKCHSFRARVRTMEHSYGLETHPSDWSPVVYQQGRMQAESCPAWDPFRTFPKFILVSILVLLLTMFLMALSVWKLQRMKTFLMPSVPDPKVTFLGLFESHQGNFQEWIQDTQNVATMDSPDLDSVPEEALVVSYTMEESKALKESPALSLPLVTPEQTSGKHPGGGQPVHLEGFTFLPHDDYVMF